MFVKKDWGINVILLENEKKWKEYFYTLDNDTRLIRRNWVDTMVVIRNMSSYIMTLIHEEKQ